MSQHPAPSGANRSSMQRGRKVPWFLSPTKAETLQTLPVETRVALLLWKPKPCLSQFPTLINDNQRDQKRGRSDPRIA